MRFHNFTLADNGALFVAAGSAFPVGVDPTTVLQPSVGQYESQPKDYAAAFELAWVVDDRARDVTDMQVMAGLQNSTLIAYTAQGQVGGWWWRGGMARRGNDVEGVGMGAFELACVVDDRARDVGADMQVQVGGKVESG